MSDNKVETNTSPSGKYAVTVQSSGGREHTLTNTASGDTIVVISGPVRGPSQFFVRDGVEWYQTLRTSKTPLLVNLETGEEFDLSSDIFNIDWHKAEFSPDGMRVAVYGYDNCDEFVVEFYDLRDLTNPKSILYENDFNFYEVNFIMESEIDGKWISDDTYMFEMIYEWEYKSESVRKVIVNWTYQHQNRSMNLMSKHLTSEYYIIRENGKFLEAHKFSDIENTRIYKHLCEVFNGKTLSMMVDRPDHQSLLSKDIEREVTFLYNEMCCKWKLENPTEFTVSYGYGESEPKTFKTQEEFFQFWKDILEESKKIIASNKILSQIETPNIRFNQDYTVYHTFKLKMDSKLLAFRHGKYFIEPRMQCMIDDYDPISEEEVLNML